MYRVCCSALLLNKINNIYLLDKNNLKNIHFIYIICKKFKISDKIIFKSLNKYQGLKFRKQIIYYGKNSMGSYANQLNEKERWLVTDYVMKLKSDLSK